MSAGVDLGPAVGGDEAQDLWHLLEHVQTVDVDLGTRVCVQRVVGRGRCFLSEPTCISRCWCLSHLRVELLSQVSEEILVPVRSLTVEPHDMVGTLTDPVSDQIQDAVQTGLLHTHTK